MFKKTVLWILNAFGWLVVGYVAVTILYLMVMDYRMYQAYKMNPDWLPTGKTVEYYKIFFFYYTIVRIAEFCVIVYEYCLLSPVKNRGLWALALFLFNFLILDLPLIFWLNHEQTLFWWGLPILIYAVITAVFITFIHSKRRVKA